MGIRCTLFYGLQCHLFGYLYQTIWAIKGKTVLLNYLKMLSFRNLDHQTDALYVHTTPLDPRKTKTICYELEARLGYMSLCLREEANRQRHMLLSLTT